MMIEISIVNHLIDPHQPLPTTLVGRTGAVAEFSGLVRGNEDGQPIGGLEYEAYRPMAEQIMHTIIEDLGHRHPCLFVRVIHRVGAVAVGEAAVYVVACAVHRAAALGLVGDFLDRLKQDVPIWKTGTLGLAGRPLPPSP